MKVSLLFDSKLDKAFRKFAADRVKHRLSEVGLPVLIETQARPFPQLPEPTGPAAALTPPPPPPAPIVIQPPAPAPVAPKAEEDWGQIFFRELMRALPLLLGLALLGYIVLRLFSRMENMAWAQSQPPMPEEQPPTITPELIEDDSLTPRTARPLPPPDRDELQSDLRLHRSSTRRVFRRLLAREEFGTVARSVALLGDFVVQDLAQDPELRRQLAAAGTRTAEVLRAPITDEEREEVFRLIQAELVADRVAHRAEDVRPEFETLLGWSPEAFATMVERLDPRAQLVLLRHAPGHLTETYLRGMEEDERTQLVRRLLEEAPADPIEIESLGAAIEDEAPAALVSGYEADHIVDLLDALPAQHQDELVSGLESTRPRFVRRNLGQIPVESALLRVSDAALESAWAAVPLADWLTYLRVAPPGIRTRALATCPERLRETVDEELSLRVAGDRSAGARAKKRIIRAALNAVPRLGAGS